MFAIVPSSAAFDLQAFLFFFTGFIQHILKYLQISYKIVRWHMNIYALKNL